MKTILLTGATGFIGSCLLGALLEKTEFNVIILKRSNSDVFRIKNSLDKVKFYDIDTYELSMIFEENIIDGILHLATYYVKSHAQEDIEKMIDANVKFPTLLLELCHEYKVKFFINTGTFFEYSSFSNPIYEKSAVIPFNLYASTKSSFDAILNYYAHNTHLNIVTLKLSAPFGYNDNFKLIPFLIDSVLKNNEVSLEKGEQSWDFIYVKDVVSAYLKTIELCLNTKRTLNEEILIGTGKSTTIKEIVNIIHEISNTNLISMEKDYSEKQIFLSLIDNSKAKNLLQWNPQYTIKEALFETYTLYKENSL